MTPLPSARRRAWPRAGFALESALLMVILLAGIIGAAVGAAVMVQRSSTIETLGTRVQYAAEAGGDAVMAQLQGALADGVISDTELGAITPPTLTGFTYDRVRADRVGAPVARTITNGSYAGLFGLNQRIDVDIVARDALGNRANVVVSVNTQAIPLFQFGVFYQDDLEIHNGPPLTFAGWVHTNSNLYLRSNAQNFEDLVTTPRSVFHRFKDGRSTGSAGPGTNIDNAAGNGVRLDFDSESHPVPQDFVNRSQARFDGRLQTSAHGVTPLNLPLPTGVPAVTLVRPRNAGDAPEVRDVKFAWKTDMHIVLDLANPAAFCASLGDAAVMDRPGLEKPSAADCATIFRFTPNAFHEGRELIGADVFDVDVGALMGWFAAAPAARLTGDRNSIVYVTFANASAADGTRDYPVLRLRNGAALSYPFTVATDQPLYVQGSYNPGTWQPASLLGDAITFLSGSWSDANHPWGASCSTTAVVASCPFTMRNATAMTVNAAVAAGHSATPCDAAGPGCAVHPYGGGLENFPRFLENWGGVAMTYRGSLVSLFQSQHAARRTWNWRSPAYYGAPQRDWAFELRFRDPRNLPPGTPTVGTVNRIAFRPVY